MDNFFVSLPGLISTVGLLALWFLAFRRGRSGFIALTDPRAIMQIVISLAVLGASLYVILSKLYPSDTEKWAYGAIGTLIGYWLPGK